MNSKVYKICDITIYKKYKTNKVLYFIIIYSVLLSFCDEIAILKGIPLVFRRRVHGHYDEDQIINNFLLSQFRIELFKLTAIRIELHPI